MKETVALELSFVNSNLQLLKEQLAELNSSVELYQMQNNSEVDRCILLWKAKLNIFHTNLYSRIRTLLMEIISLINRT